MRISGSDERRVVHLFVTMEDLGRPPVLCVLPHCSDYSVGKTMIKHNKSCKCHQSPMGRAQGAMINRKTCILISSFMFRDSGMGG